MKILFCIFLLCCVGLPLYKDAYSVNVGYDEFIYYPDGITKMECKRYDSDGRLRQKTHYWKEGTPQQDEKYDINGNIVEKSHYDVKGRLHTNLDGWAGMRARYNNNRPIAETFYGEDAQMVERRHYSPSGKLLVRQVVGDKDFDPYEKFNGKPITGSERVLYYDRTGKLQGVAGGRSD